MTELKIHIGDTWQPKYLHYFGMALMGFMLIVNILHLKFIDVGGFSVIASLLPYLFSLVLADIMTEVYGYRRVRKLLYVGLSFLVLYAVFVQIAVAWKPAADYRNDAAFGAIFGATPRIILASIVAYFVTELTNSFIMSRLKVRLNGRHFMGRAIIAVALAQILDRISFFGIAFTGVMPFPAIVQACLFSWVSVMICEIVILPVTKKIAWKVKACEGVEHFDSTPHS